MRTTKLLQVENVFKNLTIHVMSGISKIKKSWVLDRNENPHVIDKQKLKNRLGFNKKEITETKNVLPFCIFHNKINSCWSV